MQAAQQDLLDPPEQLETRGIRARSDNRVFRASRVQVARAVVLDRREQLGLRERKVQPEALERRGRQELKDRAVRPVHLESRVRRVQPEVRELGACRATLEQLVRQDWLA